MVLTNSNGNNFKLKLRKADEAVLGMLSGTKAAYVSECFQS